MITTQMESLASHSLVTSIGWTLIHFLWQAALVGGVVEVILHMMCRNSAQLRYAVACTGLMVMAFAPIATLTYQIAVSDRIGSQTKSPAGSWVARDSGIRAFGDGMALSQPTEDSTAGLGAQNSSIQLDWLEFNRPDTGSPVFWTSGRGAAFELLKSSIPWFVLIWLTGVCCLAIRMLCGLHRVRCWQCESVVVTNGELFEMVSRLSKKMNLRQRIRILETAREAVPSVVGCIRPAILVPASMLSGFTAAELESIMAHELAHIRRYDYPVNLVQAVFETLLFYHPAVWRISNRIRAERENCCDDIAVEVCGNRKAFVRALAQMEEIRCNAERLAIAANNGSLLYRIRRLLDVEPVRTGPLWPAIAITTGFIALLLGGTWVAVATAVPLGRVDNAQIANAATNGSESNSVTVIIKDEKRKTEAVLTDSKTKIEHRVFTGINLSVGDEGELRESSLAMKYTNVMAYSFIPARIAEQLGATELGEIDFGVRAPMKKRPFQAMAVLDKGGLGKPVRDIESTGQAKIAQKTVQFHDLSEPVDGATTVVPYQDDAVWVPGHLAFYGLNQTNQHRFKVVRINKVALGVGPEFGPVNALVLDTANSDFGLLGTDWIQRVKGEHGEGLWFVAAEGALYFMAGTSGSGKPVINSAPAVTKLDSVTVNSRGHKNGPARMERPGVKILATHTYSCDNRVSTGWVEANGIRSPVDIGVQQENIIVYLSLMFDIVAVDATTGKSIWNMGWTKSRPIWQTVSIVQLDRDGKDKLAVELFAVDEKTGELIYEYVSLESGEKVNPPHASGGDSGHQQHSKLDSDDPRMFRVIDQDVDGITRAVIRASRGGRSATDRIRELSARDPSIFQDRMTSNVESIVSAKNPNYLLVDRTEATEVLFSLPQGSGLRAEFSGNNVEVIRGDKVMTVVVTEGKLELIDAGGVIRAWAAPDGGAEQLVIECREVPGKVVMVMKTRRIKQSPEYPNPPVQVAMNGITGAPGNEGDPPHGAIRFEILQDKKAFENKVSMKMIWHYEVQRLLEEAQAESGPSADELIHGKPGESRQEIENPIDLAPQQTQEFASKPDRTDVASWGPPAEQSGLRTRLTLITEKPTAGRPLMFKLEIKNFGKAPTEIDAQYHEPFRLLRATREGGRSAKFIGMTPQTSAEKRFLNPGESLTLWENVDVNSLFLLKAGPYQFLTEGGQGVMQALWRESNTVNVQIAAGKQTPKNRLLENLLQGLPEKWEVSSGGGITDGGKAIFLMQKHSNLKRDVTGIQIWFTEEKLADEFELGASDQTQIVTQLGHCKLGFMNVVAQRKALDIWPDYLEHIRRAANRSLSFQIE